MFIMKRTGLLLIGLASAAAFSPHHVEPSRASRVDTAVAAVGDAEIMSAILVAGSAAAAYQEYRTDKFNAVKEFTKAHTEHIQEEIESVQNDIISMQEKIERDNKPANGKTEVTVVEKVVQVEEEPAPAVKETVAVESPKPAPAKSMFANKKKDTPSPKKPAPAPKKAAPVPAPVVKQEPATPKPVAVTMTKTEPSLSRSEPRTASDSLTDLVKQVGKTVEQNKEMEDRIKARRQQQMQEETEAVDAEKEAVTVVLTKEKKEKKRGIIRKAWRVTKKVVAPWRKWENIS